MADEEYSLSYLPLSFDDLEEHVMYISEALHNQAAAIELIDDVENAILERLPFAESFEPYHSRKARKQLYYRIYVKRYVVYYVVVPNGNGKKVMEVRRKLHGLQNRDKKL